MSQGKIEDDVKLIWEDKINYPHFQSELIELNNKIKQIKLDIDDDEENDIKILIERYNDIKFSLDIDKEYQELWDMPNDGSLTYYATVFISLSKISYKQWLYSQNKH